MHCVNSRAVPQCLQERLLQEVVSCRPGTFTRHSEPRVWGAEGRWLFSR